MLYNNPRLTVKIYFINTCMHILFNKGADVKVIMLRVNLQLVKYKMKHF